MELREDFKTVLSYMGWIANSLNYPSWSDEHIGREFREKFNNAKKEFEKENIDFSKFTDEEFKILRFMNFDENSKNLIPLWLFRILPDETKVVSFSGKVCNIKEANDDVRYGCTAFMFYFD